MPHPYDALIVGAGPAGCAAAYDLARAGRRVLLLDKRNFPRGKACACGLTRKTLKALRYSVAPVIERECRDVVLQEAGPAFLTGRRSADKACEVRVHLRQPFCAMAVRERFDHFCLTQTLAAGQKGGSVELRKIEGLLALRELPTHIELDLALPNGASDTITAPVVIGADGSNGQTRRLSNLPAAANDGGAPGPAAGTWVSEAPQSCTQATAANLPPEPAWYARGFALEATVPYTLLPTTLPAGDQPHDLVFDFAPIAGGYGWLFPKADHINIGVGGFVPQTAQQASTPDGMLYETVTRTLLNTYTQQKLGVSLESLSASPGVHVTGQYLGLGGHAYTPQGRILLTGDAAGLVDPLTGEGIHSAITSGQAAAAAILDAIAPTDTPSSRPVIPTQTPSSRPVTPTNTPSSRPVTPTNTPSSRPVTPTDTPSSRPVIPTDTSSSRPEAQPERRDPCISPGEGQRHEPVSQANTEATQLAAAYARHLKPLQETLAFSQRAAKSFYREPERGFRVMRTPLLRSLVLKTYADGLPTTKLLTSLARRVA